MNQTKFAQRIGGTDIKILKNGHRICEISLEVLKTKAQVEQACQNITRMEDISVGVWRKFEVKDVETGERKFWLIEYEEI